MDPLEEFKQTYFQECDELLGDLETHLMTLQDGSTEVETLHAAFRAIHSIKGGAGAFGFDRLVSFSHTFETVLDLIREGKVELTEACIATVVRAGDIVADLVSAARTGDEPDAGFETEVLNELAIIAGADAPAGGGEPESDMDDIEFTPIRVDDAADDGDEAQSDEAAPPANVSYRITFKPTTNMYQRAHEPLIFVRELKALGALTVSADVSDLPPFEELDAEAAYLGWTFELSTSAGLQAIEEVFEFVTDDCELKIEPLDGGDDPTVGEPPAETPPAEGPAAEDPGEPAAKEPDAPSTAEAQPAQTIESAAGNEVAEATQPEPAKESPAAATGTARRAEDRPAAGQQGRSAGVTAIRVDLDKVDRLVNMVGELVITQAMISQQSDKLLAEGYPQLVQGLEELYQHTRGLQDSVMSIRAQPVNSVFSRMPRLIRELAAQTGKKIRLELSGEGTEIDKTVIEQLNDPLTHMIRNAADHGLELPEVREAAGKSPEGIIRLSAEQHGGRIIIRIADDGAGVNREKVLGKAIEKKLVAANAKLTDDEIDNLIFLPGFSTADQVSNLSGRGVGMDVVKQNINKLGGRVTVRSEPGKGSAMTMTLPLTLAVLDGMIIRVSEEKFVIPLATIIESLLPRKEDFRPVSGGRDVMQIRGQYVEIISLRRALLMAEPGPDDAIQELIVIVEVEGGDQVGLVVDEIVGQQQVVIKSLEENFDPISGIAGATILGDGNVALILDVAGLRALQKRQAAERSHKTTQTNRDQEHAA